jgi:hypothetical protein
MGNGEKSCRLFSPDGVERTSVWLDSESIVPLFALLRHFAEAIPGKILRSVFGWLF